MSEIFFCDGPCYPLIVVSDDGLSEGICVSFARCSLHGSFSSSPPFAALVTECSSVA